MLCSWRLWPSPGMYAFTSLPLVRRTRATLRIAEFGFLGVVVYTRVHTPRRCGHESRAGDFDFVVSFSRPFRTNWLMVGIYGMVCQGGFSPKKLGLQRYKSPTEIANELK